MSIDIVLLTTDTTHHLFYAWKLNARFPLSAVFLETRAVHAPFETFHPFEADRDAYEREVLLSGSVRRFDEIAETHSFESINDSECATALQAAGPAVLLVFGTGRLRPEIIRIPGCACLNLHGGNPEYYRGLDTHLWAIYHRDFANLVTTLHHVDADFDTGDIVMQGELKITRQTRLHELRSINTRVCVDVSLAALCHLDAAGTLPSCKQLRRGRYYSHMPAVLKEDCLKKFTRHTSQL
jgi:methionyl-tRNA formyltransferase